MNGLKGLPSVSYDNLELWPDCYIAKRAGQELCLSAQNFSILLLLIESFPRTVSRDEILAKLDGSRQSGKPQSVNGHISIIRKRLGAPNIIQTVRSVGYNISPD